MTFEHDAVVASLAARASDQVRAYRGKWKPPKKKPAPGAFERAVNAMDEEK